eukprot:3338803-Alexandrium_andersonii.AAC.1
MRAPEHTHAQHLPSYVRDPARTHPSTARQPAPRCAGGRSRELGVRRGQHVLAPTGAEGHLPGGPG